MDYLISHGVRPDHIAALTRGSRANLLPDRPTEQMLAAVRYVSFETRDAE